MFGGKVGSEEYKLAQREKNVRISYILEHLYIWPEPSGRIVHPIGWHGDLPVYPGKTRIPQHPKQETPE